MKTVRSFALVAAGVLGISLVVAPLGYAAEATSGATPTVQKTQTSATHGSHKTKHKTKHHQGTHKQQHMKTTT